MAADNAHAVIVHHIVVILHVALHLGVAALVVSPQAVMNRPVSCSVSNRAKALRLDALRIDAILPRDVVSIFDVHIVPRSPRHRTVVHDKVLAFVQCERTLAAVHALAASHADISHNDVLGLRGDDAPAVNGDSLSGCSLSRNGDIAGNGDALARDVDDTAHVKYYKAVRLAHGIGQRACARSIQVGYVHHRAAAST